MTQPQSKTHACDPIIGVDYALKGSDVSVSLRMAIQHEAAESVLDGFRTYLHKKWAPFVGVLITRGRMARHTKQIRNMMQSHNIPVRRIINRRHLRDRIMEDVRAGVGDLAKCQPTKVWSVDVVCQPDQPQQTLFIPVPV